MKISIAMATYNGADYIRDQLNSFGSQERKPDELVINDDGSSDGTLSIIETFARSAPFEVHITRNKKRLGCAQNFNQALSLCTGDLILLSDQDDVWFPNKIATIEDCVKAEPRTLVFINDAEITHEDLTPTGLTKLEQIRSAGISEKIFVMGCAMSVRREFLRYALPIPDDDITHDTWLSDFAAGLGRRRIIERPLQYYRRHRSNESEFMANRTRKINEIDLYLDRIIAARNKENISALQHYTRRTDRMLGRVDAQLEQHAVPESWIDDLRRFKLELVCRQDAARSRLSVTQCSRLGRLLPAAKMLIRGQYAHFNGLRSALKDILLG